jgi:probable HAF family extracellular repeat protein
MSHTRVAGAAFLAVVGVAAATAVVLRTQVRSAGPIATASTPSSSPRYQIIDLGIPPGAYSSSPISISNTGVIQEAVWSKEPSCPRNPPDAYYLWTDGKRQRTSRNTTALYPQRLGKEITIKGNHHAQFIGYQYGSDSYSRTMGFLKDRNGKTFLRLPGVVRYGMPVDLNDAGQVVGWIEVRGEQHWEKKPFLYTNGVMAVLPTPQDCKAPIPTDINEQGQIVGFAKDTDFLSPYHAILWHNGKAFDLNTQADAARHGWKLIFAHALNDRGEIIGTGSHNGKKQGFLLRPVR